MPEEDLGVINGLKPVVVVAGTRPEISSWHSLSEPQVGWAEKSRILAAMPEAVKEKKKLPSVSPIGDDTAATKTVEVIKKDFI